MYKSNNSNNNNNNSLLIDKMSTEKKDWDDYSTPESEANRRVSKQANVRAAHFKDAKNRFGVFEQRKVEDETVQLVPVDFDINDKDLSETPSNNTTNNNNAPVAKFVTTTRIATEESREWESTTSTFKVQNIPWQTTENDLYAFFGHFGQGIEERGLKLLKDKQPDGTYVHKGMAYVTFKDRESAEACRDELYANPTTWALHQQILQLDWAKKNDDNRSMGGGGGGGRDTIRSGYFGSLAQSSTDKSIIYAGINK